MDSVELARQIAGQLHAQAVADGSNPCDPYAFVLAEAKLQGVDVEPTTKGAAILDGGRATILQKDRLILHEHCESFFERAFLIAHELGHVLLEDDLDDESVLEIDPSRPSEPSPLGFDRVVDYGRRQRREIQMDLFAREFLLPRSWVRSLHLDDGLTASEIADKVGAPFEVAAQQLLDALLLPAVALSPVKPTQEAPLNEIQKIAAQHRGEAYLLEAGPGTGKTRTLVARVEGLLADGVDPRRILVLTFSNKAASEMGERIARKHREAAAAIWVGTFHAFGLDLVRRFFMELGLPRDPRMMDRTEAVELLEDRFPSFNLHHYRNIYDPTQIITEILSAISRAKDEVVDAEEYARLARSMGSSEAAERAAEVAQVYGAYERLKRDANCVDFGDLVLLPVQLLETNPGIRSHIQSMYDHVLVDEYQDVNRSSTRLLEALKPDGHNLWVVGDAKQSIYRFRGASPFSMTRFGTQDFPGAKRERLDRNYRSSAEIVNSFSTFAATMRLGDGSKALDSNRGPNGINPKLLCVRVAEQHAVAVADSIETLRSQGLTYREQAVLCTGNEKLSTLARDLELLGVPVLFLGSLFERPEVKDLLCLLSVLIDRRAMGLVRLGCWTEFKMQFADVAATLEFLRLNEVSPGTWLQSVDAIPKLTDRGATALRSLQVALHGFDQSSSPWTVLVTLLLDRTRMAARLGSSVNIADRSRAIAIWQFLNFLRVQPSGQGLPIARLLDRVRRLVRLGDDRDLRQLPNAAQGLDAVRLMTIHGAKGLEFSAIHIPGVNADTIPRVSSTPICPPPEGMIQGATASSLETYREGQVEEQECLFYVAMSRAKDHLLFYAPMEKSNGHNRPVSSFLGRVGAALERTVVVPQRSIPKAAEEAALQLTFDGAIRFGAPQIALYESCPRRFFYTHILQVGGRRASTAFMKMHDAVRVMLTALTYDGKLVGPEDLEARIEAALRDVGLADHGHREEFSTLALTMLRYFVSTQEGCANELPVAINLKFGDEEIVVRADDILIRPDQSRVVRRIQTGHLRSSETKDVGAAAFVLAVQQAFPDAVAEIVHLSDGTSQRILLSAKELQNRRTKLQGFLGDIKAGVFPAVTSAFTCPGCPAFFICGATPEGPLQKKVS